MLNKEQFEENRNNFEKILKMYENKLIIVKNRQLKIKLEIFVIYDIIKSLKGIEWRKRRKQNQK